MKKKRGFYFPIFGLLTLITFSGCGVVVHQGLISSSAVVPATNETLRPGFPLRSKNYKVLGRVEGQSKATNILYLFAFGDGGINSAYEQALKQIPEADMLTDVHIDTHYKGFLVFFNSQTTIVKGVAIKLIDRPKKKRSKQKSKSVPTADEKSTTTDSKKQ